MNSTGYNQIADSTERVGSKFSIRSPNDLVSFFLSVGACMNKDIVLFGGGGQGFKGICKKR